MIKEDAKNLLIKIYEHYVTVYDFLGNKTISNLVNFSGQRIDRALRFLKDRGLIDLIYIIDMEYDNIQAFRVSKLINHYGIDVIENKEKFVNAFGNDKGWIERWVEKKC